MRPLFFDTVSLLALDGLLGIAGLGFLYGSRRFSPPCAKRIGRSVGALLC